MKLTIDPKFHDLIPPISKEEYDLLEESILKEGCLEPIVVWGNCIIDGHNRYEICRKHKIKPGLWEKEFDNDQEAKIWIIKNQLGRRNLPPHERARLALLLKPTIEEKAKEQQKRKPESVPQISAKQKIETRDEVAKIAGVSHDTVRKVETIEAEATPEVKEAVRKGKMSVNKAYKETKGKQKKEESVYSETEYPETSVLKPGQSRNLALLKDAWHRANQTDRRRFLGWILLRQETPKGFLLDIIHSENPEFRKRMKEDRKKRRGWIEGNYSGLNEGESESLTNERR